MPFSASQPMNHSAHSSSASLLIARGSGLQGACINDLLEIMLFPGTLALYFKP